MPTPLLDWLSSPSVPSGQKVMTRNYGRNNKSTTPVKKITPSRTTQKPVNRNGAPTKTYQTSVNRGGTPRVTYGQSMANDPNTSLIHYLFNGRPTSNNTQNKTTTKSQVKQTQKTTPSKTTKQNTPTYNYQSSVNMSGIPHSTGGQQMGGPGLIEAIGNWFRGESEKNRRTNPSTSNTNNKSVAKTTVKPATKQTQTQTSNIPTLVDYLKSHNNELPLTFKTESAPKMKLPSEIGTVSTRNVPRGSAKSSNNKSTVKTTAKPKTYTAQKFNIPEMKGLEFPTIEEMTKQMLNKTDIAPIKIDFGNDNSNNTTQQNQGMSQAERRAFNIPPTFEDNNSSEVNTNDVLSRDANGNLTPEALDILRGRINPNMAMRCGGRVKARCGYSTGKVMKSMGGWRDIVNNGRSIYNQWKDVITGKSKAPSIIAQDNKSGFRPRF